MLWGDGKVLKPVGSEMASYQTEGTALLALMWFLSGKICKAKVVIHTDSESCYKTWQGIEEITVRFPEDDRQRYLVEHPAIKKGMGQLDRIEMGKGACRQS